MEQNVPKRRHIKSRRREFTQKQDNDMQNTENVWKIVLWFFRKENLLRNICIKTNHSVTCGKNSLFLSLAVLTLDPFLPTHFRFRVFFFWHLTTLGDTLVRSPLEEGSARRRDRSIIFERKKHVVCKKMSLCYTSYPNYDYATPFHTYFESTLFSSRDASTV